jgi:hypothetical protein
MCSPERSFEAVYLPAQQAHDDFSLSLQVQAGLRLPLTGLAPPRLLMCSASMGAEGSVTLQLREAVQAEPSGTINNVTIGYPDTEVLADVLGTFQAAGSDATFENASRPQNTFFKASGLTTTTINKTETGTWLAFGCGSMGKDVQIAESKAQKTFSIMLRESVISIIIIQFAFHFGANAFTSKFRIRNPLLSTDWY